MPWHSSHASPSLTNLYMSYWKISTALHHITILFLHNEEMNTAPQSSRDKGHGRAMGPTGYSLNLLAWASKPCSLSGSPCALVTTKERWVYFNKGTNSICYTWYLWCIDVAWTDDDTDVVVFYEDLRSENHLNYLSREKRLKRAHKESRPTISCYPLKQIVSLYKFTMAVSPSTHI